MRRFLLFSVLSVVAVTASAEIFKSVDEFGNVVFSDLPPTRTSEKVTVTPMNSYEAPAVTAPATPPASASATLDSTYYGLFQIADPAPDSAIRDNAGNVTISVALSPALRGDHRLLLVLDGQATEVEAENNQFVLGNLDRGSHTAAARIVDRSGATVAQTPETTFHMLRVSVAAPPPSAG